MGILRNNIAFTGTAVANGTGSGIDAANNTWNLSTVTVSAADFVSVDTVNIYGPRKADGSLPDINFLKLAAGSDLIDKGVDVGLPCSGEAPDLDAFETGTTSLYRIVPSYGASFPTAVEAGTIGSGMFTAYDLSGRRMTVSNRCGAAVRVIKTTEGAFHTAYHHPGMVR